MITEAILGQAATPETVAAFNKELGLDRPTTVRYVEWIGGILVGDFGNSYAGAGGSIKRSVSALIISSAAASQKSIMLGARKTFTPGMKA